MLVWAVGHLQAGLVNNKGKCSLKKSTPDHKIIAEKKKQWQPEVGSTTPKRPYRQRISAVIESVVLKPQL